MAVIATPTIYNSPLSVDPNTGEGIGGLGYGGIVTADAIRLFLEDTPAMNILSGGKIEFSDAKIEQAVMSACSEYNVIAPLTHVVRFDGSDWPIECPHLLILGASAWLLKGVASSQIRNQFNAQDGICRK